MANSPALFLQESRAVLLSFKTTGISFIFIDNLNTN
jgi:hypothetical protein